MKRFIAIAAACLCASPLCAQTYFFFGTIGKAPVFASLSRNGDNLNGWYLYTKYSKQIELGGKIDKAGAFHLDESSFDTMKKTGSFAGSVKQDVWSGMWQSVGGGAPVAFSLTENRDRLANLSGDFRCTEKHTDKQYGFVYSRSAHVTFAKGMVTRVDLTQESKSKEGDSQGCYIGLSDFARVSSDTGVVLRAKDDKPGSDTQHCSIRIVGNASFLYVSPGDLSEDGNDCKGVDDDIMFCSPRANWGDFLIDRSGVCKPND